MDCRRRPQTTGSPSPGVAPKLTTPRVHRIREGPPLHPRLYLPKSDYTVVPRRPATTKNEMPCFQSEVRKEISRQRRRETLLKTQVDMFGTEVVTIKTTMSLAQVRVQRLERELKRVEDAIAMERDGLRVLQTALVKVAAEEAQLQEERDALLQPPDVVPVVRDSELLRAVSAAQAFLNHLEGMRPLRHQSLPNLMLRPMYNVSDV